MTKQEVLLDFVQNKAVLRAIFDLMFTDKGVRNYTSSSLLNNGSTKDFNQLWMNQ